LLRVQEKTSELSSKATKAAREAEQKLSDAANKVQDMSDKALGQAKVRRGPPICGCRVKGDGVWPMSCQTPQLGSATQHTADMAWQPVCSAGGTTAVRPMQLVTAWWEHCCALRVSQIEPVHILSATQAPPRRTTDWAVTRLQDATGKAQSKAEEAAGMSEGEAKGKAKGKAEELKGRAKGTAAEAEGKAEEVGSSGCCQQGAFCWRNGRSGYCCYLLSASTYDQRTLRTQKRKQRTGAFEM
jgi:hypothetical protein